MLATWVNTLYKSDCDDDVDGDDRDRGDHFKVVGLKNLANTKKH